MKRLSVVGAFLLAVLCAEIVLHFSIRTFAGHHPDNPALQALASII